MKSYQQWGILTRTFMLREHAAILDEVRAGTGKYATYPKEAQRFVIASVYVEMFERLCLLVEDFLSLCYASWGDLTEFPARIVNPWSPAKILSAFTSDKWAVLLRWAPIETLNLTTEDQLLLARVRGGNIEVLDRFLKVLDGFLKLYWLGWTKRKHANTWIQSMEEVFVAGEPTFIIPVVYDPKNPTATKTIIVNNTIYSKWQALSNDLVLLSKDIVDAAPELVERVGGRSTSSAIATSSAVLRLV